MKIKNSTSRRYMVVLWENYENEFYSTRIVRRCELTGRARGVYRKFRISRIMLRKLALEGKIPGMRKASW